MSQKNFCNSKLVRFLAIALVLFALVRLYYYLTDDFRISNITYEIEYRPEWETPPLTEEEQLLVGNILKQKFHYIGKGAQSYAFVSDDGKYVLKFFKFKHLRPSLLFGILPKLPLISSFQEREIARKERKLKSNFIGYKLAFEKNRAESRLIDVRLNPDHQSRYVTVIDKIGISREVDLGSVPYIIQEKGEILRVVLGRLLSQGDVATAKERIAQIFNMYLKEYQKGIYDHDHGVMYNTGFVGNEPFHLDIGKLMVNEKMKDPATAEADLRLVANKINEWTERHYPKAAPEIAKTTEQLLTTLFEEHANLF